MRIPGGKKHWGASARAQKAVSKWSNHGQGCQEQLPKAGEKGLHPLLIPVHLRARKALGLIGVSNKWLYCVCPARVQARAGVMGTVSASEERKEIWPQGPRLAPLLFADRLRATSPEPFSGCFHHLPKASRTPSQS